MLEFTCDCGRRLKVSEDLAGWQTQCPGCQQLIPVPSPNAPAAPAGVPKRAAAELPWKGIAIGAACVDVIAIIIAAMSRGGSKAPDEDTERTISKLKKQLADRDHDLESMTAQGDPAKLAERARAAEGERDRVKSQMEVLQRQLDDTRVRLARLEKGGAPPAPSATDSPEPKSNVPSPPSPAPGGATDFTEQCAPFVVLVNSDRDFGGGFFISPDGLVVTSYRAIAQSEMRNVTYVEGKGDGRMRINAEAEVAAVDMKHDLALLKINVRKLVPCGVLEEWERVVREQEVVVLTNPVPGTRSIDHTLITGKVVALDNMINGIAHLQTTVPLNQANSGVPLFNRDGKIIGLTTLRGDGAGVGSLAVPVVHIKGLMEGRETTFAVRGTLKNWELKNASRGSAPGEPVKEHPTGIGVGGVITRLHVDEELDRIVGLDVENGHVAVMSIKQRKILRTIPVGRDAVDMQMTVNPDVAWVANAESRLFIKMNLEEGRIFDRIEAVRFGRAVATRNHIWTYGPSSQIVALKDKVGVQNPLKFGALTYDKRRDRLIGLVTNWDPMKLVEFDPDKLGPQLKDISEIQAGGPQHPRFKELEGLVKGLDAQWKTWSVPPRYEDWAPTGWSFSLMTDGSTRVLLNRFALKRDKMDAVLARFPLVPIPETASTPMIEALQKWGRVLDNFQAVSPDGRWMSTGRHIYNSETGNVQLEIPVPSPDSRFSADSKILYVYDLSARAIVPIEVEAKAKK